MGLLTIAGYELREELYNGYRNLVYRGVREADSLPVVIKLLKNPYPSFSELVQFRNQYTIAKNLNHPGIIQTYSLETYRNGYTLVMEDFGGISLKDYFIHNNHVGALDEFLEIATYLSNTLDYLMGHGIIHKDIKPANIVINPETKQVKLIDFSIASLLPRETQTLISANILEGTLGYISPEQTGRINRGIDYRTDFYSLGVTFYELLTKELPFQSEDRMELVYCHIAKTAPLVHEINETIPSVLSEIVSKLMAKNPSDRYQSALGLKYDLEKCWLQLRETGSIESFAIAQRDVCDRFVIPEKLYGREQEAKQLLAAFERVAQGNSELMLVTGFSGIGKTVVVNEVHKPIVKQRGYFIKGKYDQFNRNIPFSAFVEAFRDLMGQILTEDDTKLQQWRDKIIKALGENAQVVIQVIPELERIIGSQPPAVELSGMAAQNRFNFLFQKFIQVFTTPEHPLVIFLDDLQWADSSSLKLMQMLMAESEQGYLFLIGAYRDNEVFPGHPLILTLDEIASTGANVDYITLSPLSIESVNQLVADTLNCQLEIAQPLTQLVYQKTKGNPFFSTQFLKALHEDNYIQFNFQFGHWQCDIAEIKQLALTDDVVEFIAQQLGKLGAATQYVLKLAACIGNQFDLATLAIVSQQSQAETAVALWKALQSGLILPISEVYKFYVGQEKQAINQEIAHTVGYKFLHDRVQQAAYSLIPEDQKQTTHVKIGRLLWGNTPEAELENQIFGIVNQLNMGLEQFQQAKERHELSRLNLIAGKKAKASTAYSSGLAYLKIGIQLIPSNLWKSDYSLTIQLYTEASEASYLCGEMDAMEDFAQEVLQKAKAITDTAKVYEIKIEAYAVQGKFLAAIDTGLEFLQIVGVKFPKEPTPEDFVMAMEETQGVLRDKTVAELVNLPEMEDSQLRVALRVLVKLNMPAYLAKPELHRLVVLKQVTLCVKYGNASGCVVAYSQYGLMLCGQVDSISTGYEFGQLALQLLSKFPEREYEALILFLVHSFIIHWKEPLTATLKPLIQAYTTGLDTGDLAHANAAANVYCFHAYFAGYELTKLCHELVIYRTALEKINQKSALNYYNICHQVILNLIEPKINPWELVGAAYDERSMLALHEQINDGTGLWHLFVNKLILCYLFQDLDLAVEFVFKAKQYSASGYAMSTIPLLNFYDSLLQLALFPKSSTEEQKRILQQVAENQNIMQQWANYAPMNHLHRLELVEAEKYRVLGQKTSAMEFYDQAIALAKENGYIQEEALANELAAKFYLNWGRHRVAADYMQEAYYCYARWGALAKTNDLEKRYPQLLTAILQSATVSSLQGSSTTIQTTVSNSTSNISSLLDLDTIVKISQSFTSEIHLERLVEQVMQAVVSNAGADKGALILNQEGGLAVVSQYVNSQVYPFEIQPLDSCLELPISIFHYVARTLELTIANAEIPHIFSGDPYFSHHSPQSLLCTPILKQGQLIGLLYLENNLTSFAFTGDRLEILNLLCTQAAISLENASLYNTLESKVIERTCELSQALNDLKSTQKKLVESEKMAALGGLVAGIAHEINTPVGVSITLASTLAEETKIFQATITEGQLKKSVLNSYLNTAQECSRIMLTNLQRAGELIQSFKQVAVDQTNLEQRQIPLKSYIDDILTSLSPKLRQAGHSLTVTGDESIQIFSYPGAIAQLLVNLLNNSLQHAYPTGNPGHLEIHISHTQEDVTLVYSDDGCGIPPQALEKIFDPFFTTARDRGGTGLGLHIVYNLVTQKLGGAINVYSQVGLGTVFTIQLPWSL